MEQDVSKNGIEGVIPKIVGSNIFFNFFEKTLGAYFRPKKPVFYSNGKNEYPLMNFIHFWGQIQNL